MQIVKYLKKLQFLTGYFKKSYMIKLSNTERIEIAFQCNETKFFKLYLNIYLIIYVYLHHLK